VPARSDFSQGLLETIRNQNEYFFSGGLTMMIFYVPLIVAGAVASFVTLIYMGYQSNKKWFEKHPTFDAY